MKVAAPQAVTAVIDDEVADRLIGGAHHDPHSVLGAHLIDGAVVVRTLRPDATAVDVVVDDTLHPLSHQRDGLWTGVLAGVSAVPDYTVSVTFASGTYVGDDPYRWLPTLGEVDQHLISEGRHERLWTVLGAHPRSYDTAGGTVTGTSFAVWAPNARGLRVVGDFNFWDGRGAPMRSLGSSGVWEIFLPDVHAGARYVFHVLGADSVWRTKADPMAFGTDVPPSQHSVVQPCDGEHEWGGRGVA